MEEIVIKKIQEHLFNEDLDAFKQEFQVLDASHDLFYIYVFTDSNN